jgi:peptidoglycan hydrolase CwlO-like protein
VTNKEQRKIKLEKTADKATRWIGSTNSLLVHTIVFIISFVLPLVGLISFERMLLVLTTLVSLEAIYLAIFIQMSVNKNSQDIEIIQEDVGEIQENIEDIGEDIEDISEDIEDIQKDVDEIQGDSEEEIIEKKETAVLMDIQSLILKLQEDIDLLKKK